MILPRVVSAEALDHLAAHDPAAQRSRRDLVRIHSLMGTRAMVCSGWQALVGARRAGAALRILELGAGDGTLLLGVARALQPAWPHVQLSLLDRQNIVSVAALASYADLGWSVNVEVADVLAWAQPARAEAAARSSGGLDSLAGRPSAPTAVPAPRWDLISTTLFLHHFEGAELDALLAAIAARSQRFFACEPRRAGLALAASHLVGAIGANAVTRQDAGLSVRAGFRANEIAARWPGAGADWTCREYAAGLFSHCFSAQRAGAAAGTGAGAGAD